VKTSGTIFLSLALMLILPITACGQAPKTKYSGNFGGGFALTGGNAHTRSFNLSFDLLRDSKNKNTVKSNGLYLRSSVGNSTSTDLLRLNVRDDFLFTKRTSIYGAMGYQRDPFKGIDYLLNPQGGISFRAYSTDRATFSLSGGTGVVWERDGGAAVPTRGSLNAGESFSCKLTETARLTQNAMVMRKTRELVDALYHFDIALSTSVAKKVALKVEFIDEYKNKTPVITIKKNDTTLITSIVFKL
jgi:putative salt-induced outer membrane protein YdiY